MTTTTVIACIDSSAVSKNALIAACRLAEGLHASVTLVHVIDLDAHQSLVPFEHHQSKEILHSLVHAGNSLIDLAQTEVAKVNPALVVHKKLPHGRAADALVETINTTSDVALVCIGHTTKETWLIGSVAKHVIHQSKSPVLTLISIPSAASAATVAKLDSMLIPLDGSDSSFLAFHSALHIGRSVASKFTCLYTVDPRSKPSTTAKNETLQAVINQVEMIATNHNTKVDFVAGASISTADQSAAEMIIEESKKHDLLVVSSKYLPALFGKLEDVKNISVLFYGPLVSDKHH